MSFFVCLVILILDVAAGICGIEAEKAQNKEKHLRMWPFECRQPSHDAYLLGLAAATLIAITQLAVTLLGGGKCLCSRNETYKSSSHNRQLAIVCFIFTWIALAVGISLLIIGALGNDKSRSSCGFTHHHTLFIGGILCFVHGFFCIAFYASVS